MLLDGSRPVRSSQWSVTERQATARWCRWASSDRSRKGASWVRTVPSWTSPRSASTSVRPPNRASARRWRCSSWALPDASNRLRHSARSAPSPCVATTATTAPSTAGSADPPDDQRRRASAMTPGSSASVPAAASTTPRSCRVRSSSPLAGAQPSRPTMPVRRPPASEASVRWRSGATRSSVPMPRRTACHTARSGSSTNDAANPANAAGSCLPASVAAHRSSTVMERSTAVSRPGS